MTVFMQAILKGALAPRHVAKGLWLDEDDHSLTLKDENSNEIAHWGIYAKMVSILNEADNYLIKKGIQC